MPYMQLLKLRGMEIDRVSTPKQTDTTQHWKILLKTSATPLPLHTKIEFSRRSIDAGITLSTINSTLTQAYHLTPLFIPHYNGETALQQKIQALIGCTDTQARDVFDIHLLAQQIPNTDFVINKFNAKQRESAISNALNISLDQFNGQVLSYLEHNYQAQYNDSEVWEKMQLSVVEMLS